MVGDILVAATIIVPSFTGIAYRLIGSRSVRRGAVFVTVLTLIASTLLLFYSGGFSLTPPGVFESVVLILDFLVLAYFFFTGLKRRSLPVVGLTLLQILPLIYLEFSTSLHAEPVLVADRLSVLMSIIINVVGSLVIIYSMTYMDEHERHNAISRSRQPRFFLYMLLLLGAMNGLVYSNSLYWLYFFWEVTTLCCYELIRHDGNEVAESNALRALWMGLIGGVAFVATMFIGHYALGNIALDRLLGSRTIPILMLGFAFLALAAFTKSAQFPFHSWLLGAMVAPTPVSALLHSSTMVNAGVYLILRIIPAIRGTYLTWAVALLGAFTFMFTSVLAISQRESKSILAYSTIGNLGLIITCAGINTSLSYAAALTLLLFHSIFKGMLFLGAGIVENRLHSRNIETWEGLLGRLPLTTTVMILGMVSMFLPPFGVLLGKWVAVEAASSVGTIPLVILIIFGSAATTLFWAKWLGYLTILPLRESKLSSEKLPKPYLASLLAMLSLGFLLSIGAASVANVLLIPAVSNAYGVEVSMPLFSVRTSIGAFPVWFLWLAATAVVATGLMVGRIKGGVVKPPYLGGENLSDPQKFRTTADSEIEFKVSGMFFDSELKALKIERYATLLGVVLVILIFTMAVI